MRKPYILITNLEFRQNILYNDRRVGCCTYQPSYLKQLFSGIFKHGITSTTPLCGVIRVISYFYIQAFAEYMKGGDAYEK